MIIDTQVQWWFKVVCTRFDLSCLNRFTTSGCRCP